MPSVKDILKNTSDRMSKTLFDLKDEFLKVRTGKASPKLLDGVKADYYGAMTAINQLGNITTPDFHTLVVQPYDKSILGEIEKAILSANLGLNPTNDGSIIRIPIPPLTEERRKEFVKVIKKHAEDHKVAIRNIRRDSNEEIKKVEKEQHISEDERKHAEGEVQKLTDKFIKEIDNAVIAKEKEIMEV